MKRVLISASLLLATTVSFAQLKVNSTGNAAIGINPNSTDRLIVDGGALRVGSGYSSTDRAKNMIKIGDSDYIQIGEWEADDRLSFKASGYNFTKGTVSITSTDPGPWNNTMVTYIGGPYAKSYVVCYNNDHKAYIRGDGFFVGSGTLSISDATKKENIQRIPNALDKVLSLNGVTYSLVIDNSNEGKLTKRDMGVLAQEVQKVAPEAVEALEDGCLAVLYNSLVGLLIEAIKEQQQRIEALEKACSSNNTLKSGEITATQDMYLSDDANAGTLKLYQNAPNPFNQRTTVKCYVPEQFQKVQLCVYNMQGKQVQCLSVTERGNVSIEIEAGALSAGIYSYVLLADGAASETKQMILTK